MQNNQEIKAPVLIEDLGMQYATKKSKYKVRFGAYKCLCGEMFNAVIQDVKRNKIKSCGCLITSKTITHKCSRHILYNVYMNMMKRVYDINNKDYSTYGKFGIKVCDRWLDVRSFIEDMYPTYQEGLTLDRINSYGDYEPSNCRWTTSLIQGRNKKIIQKNNTSGYRGVSKHTNKWSACICVNYKTIYLGIYDTPKKAAIVYDKYIIENNLEHTTNGLYKKEIL